MPSRQIPCVFARAGTSRGAFLLVDDLPADPETRDAVVLAIYGSPDSRQINGLGGGDPLTSKVALVARSARPDADVDYTFGQVGIDVPRVFWVGNCGNMSSGVGPFAIEKGLVSAEEPETVVRIYNTNTEKILTARVQVKGGRVLEEGTVCMAGVPGTGAPILLDFGDCGGSVSGLLLPTGRVRDTITLRDGTTVDFSLVDAATPFVFVAAKDVGAVGTESAAEIDSDHRLLDRLEQIRSHAARVLGLVPEGADPTVVSPSIPRVTMVAEPLNYTTSEGAEVRVNEHDLLARQMSMQRTHKTYSVTGALCTSVAAVIPGTVVNAMSGAAGHTFRIGHPGGVIEARVRVDRNSVPPRVVEASLVRTARKIMDGHVHVPNAVWPVDR